MAATEGGVMGVVSPLKLSCGLPWGLARALTSREMPEEEDILLEKDS